ncbi:MAG: hypothetical protein ACN6NT_07710, partial [Comamonas sp.]
MTDSTLFDALLDALWAVLLKPPTGVLGRVEKVWGSRLEKKGLFTACILLIESHELRKRQRCLFPSLRN